MTEELFRQAVACLQKAKLNFWIDYGTLLGLVREGRIIAGDGDFDFGVWEHEVTEEDLIRAFDPKDFAIVSLSPYGKKAMHIIPLDIETDGLIDITFYRKQGERAIHRSYARKDNFLTDWFMRLECFLYPQVYEQGRHRGQIEKTLHQALARLLPAVVKRAFKRKFYALMLGIYVNGIKLTYDFPACYFEDLRHVSFLGVEVKIPADAPNYLTLAYGKDWQTPKKWQHWYDGATYINGQRNLA